MVVERPRGIERLALRPGDWPASSAPSGFDLVIDFHGGPRSSLLTLATGAPQRIGYDLPGRRWCYTDARAVDAFARSASPFRGQSVGTARAARHRPIPIRAAHPVTMQPDAPAVAARRRFAFATPAYATTAPLIVFHVSAGNPFRRWPAASFAQVAATLAAADRTRRIVITSGPSERRGRRRGDRRSARASPAMPPRGSLESANSICRSCGRWSSGPRSTSAATADRCISRRRPTRRSSRCSAPRCLNDRCRGATRRSAPSPLMADRCRAVPVISATACRETFAA